jgi:Pyruvate/2-oxoacid:ferredoxin oxidoreductase delta subunit
MCYRKAVIYYLSGTGNSFRVSCWMAQHASDSGVDVKMVSVNDAEPVRELDASTETLLALVFPTHGFTAPWHMIKFALRLPRRRLTHVFCLATRAGLRLGRLYPPGISGSATFLIALILFLKGYRVRGTSATDMPSNWYSLHPIQGEKSVEQIRKRAIVRTRASMARILDGRRLWFTWNNLYEVILGILLSYISFLYLIKGRFFLAKLFFANRNCDGCGICATNCPVGAIDMKGSDLKWPFWRYNCESCMKCAAFCPQNAIEAGHSWFVILIYVATLPVTGFLLVQLAPFLPTSDLPESSPLVFVLEFFLFFPVLFFSYFVFSRLLRVPLINRIFSLTTFTHLPSWGRYREPETRLKDLRSSKKK